MRNHRKIKAIRTKFKVNGYGIWCMLLEYLTGSDGNVFAYTDVELELMAGDFGVSVTEIRDVVDYCIRLELLFLKDGFINSESLDERLKSVYEKRDIAKTRSRQQDRSNGKFAPKNAVTVGVSVTEMPQSKVKESKVKESKENTTVGGDESPKENKKADSGCGGAVGNALVSPPEPQISSKKRKPKKDANAEPFWKELVAVYFSFCFEKFDEKPSFDGSAPSDMHRIIECLKKRATEKNIEWTEETAKLRWREFLGRAYQDNWLSQNWMLSNINRQKDKIFLNLISGKNGTHSNAASEIGATFESD